MHLSMETNGTGGAYEMTFSPATQHNFTAVAANLYVSPPPYEEEAPEMWQTIVYGLLIVSAASFFSPTAFLLIPLLSKALYERCMVFLVALGIGAMSGSCIFILIPQAFNITEVKRFDYTTKCWLMISALYIFFTVDRLLQCVIEYRKRRNNSRKIHVSTVDAMIGKRNRLKLFGGVSRASGAPVDEPPPPTANRHVPTNPPNGSSADGKCRRKNGWTQQHSLTIDDGMIIDNNSSSVAGDDAARPPKRKRRFPHFRRRGRKTTDTGSSVRRREAEAKHRRQQQSETERQELEDEIDVSLYDNALTRAFSTRNTYAVVRPVKADWIHFESADGTARVKAPKRYVDEVNRGAERLTSACRDGVHPSRESDGANLENGKGPPPAAEAPHPHRESMVNGAAVSAASRHPHTHKLLNNFRKNSNAANVYMSQRQLRDRKICVAVETHEKVVIERAQLEVASVAYMIIFGSSANNFVDGMSTGAAFSDSIMRGVTIGVAVLSQQFPQELGTLAILVKSGLGVKRALLFNFIPIVLSYVGFGFGVFLDNVDDSYDSFIFSISAGMYFYIFLGTLVPEIRESFNETLKTDVGEAALCTALQFSGITFGVGFLRFMNSIHADV